jgi:hypothetical protein
VCGEFTVDHLEIEGKRKKYDEIISGPGEGRMNILININDSY